MKVSSLQDTQHSSTEHSLEAIKQSSFQAFNLVRMISEVGAKHQLSNLSQIEGRRKLSFDDLAKFTEKVTSDVVQVVNPKPRRNSLAKLSEQK